MDLVFILVSLLLAWVFSATVVLMVVWWRAIAALEAKDKKQWTDPQKQWWLTYDVSMNRGRMLIWLAFVFFFPTVALLLNVQNPAFPFALPLGLILFGSILSLIVGLRLDLKKLKRLKHLGIAYPFTRAQLDDAIIKRQNRPKTSRSYRIIGHLRDFPFTFEVDESDWKGKYYSLLLHVPFIL